MIAWWFLPITTAVTWLVVLLAYDLPISPWAARRASAPKVNDWHIGTSEHGCALEVRRRDPSLKYTTYWIIQKSYGFDPNDVESRAAALAQAEATLEGLRDVEQRAREISKR